MFTRAYILCSGFCKVGIRNVIYIRNIHYVICRLAQVQCAHVCIDAIRIPSVADIYFET